MIEVHTWQVVTFFIGLFVSFIGVAIGLAKMVLSQFEMRQDETFSVLLDYAKRESDNIQQLERDFLAFKTDVALQYVRREDYVRGQSVLEAKMDALFSRMEVIQLKGNRHD